MSIFSNMNTEGMEQVKDSVGGFSLLDSGVYPAKVKAVYMTKASSSNAMAANLLLDIDGREYRETIYITNKNGENFFVNQKTGNKVPLPGFTLLNDLCLLTVKEPLCKMDTEDKVFKLYDYEAKTELPKSVPTITALSDQEVVVGIIKQVVDKNVKNADGKYVPSGDTREENIIDKFFHAESKCTVNEISAEKTEHAFLDKWIEKNAGKTRNKATGKKEGTAGAPQKPAAQTKSLFG